MAITDISISEELMTNAPSIKYRGNEGPKSPQEMQQMMIASLEEEYAKNRFEMLEQGREPMSLQEFIEQAMAEAQMSEGPVLPNDPTEPVNPFQPKPQGPTLPNRQMAAYGGIMGLDGRKQYGIGSWFQEKIMDPIKGNPALTAAIVGGGINQFGLPDWMVPDQIATGSNVGQNWLGDLLGKVTPGDTQFNTVIGDKVPFRNVVSQLTDPNQENTALTEKVKNLTGGGINPADPRTWAYLNNMAKDPTGLLERKALRKFSELSPTDMFPDDRNIFQKIYGGVTGFLGPSTMTGADGKPIQYNWKAPVAAGLSIGALDAATRKKDVMPQDTSGINIADIRRRALTGSDPDLHFLPQASATTAYAQGGRTGYQDAGEVQQDVFMAWDEYKSGGGEENFNDWFNNIYLPGAGQPGVRSPQDLMEIERKAEALVQAGVVENKADAMEILQRSYPRPSLTKSDSYMKPMRSDSYMKSMSATMDAPKDFEGIGGLRKLPDERINLLGREQFEDDLPYGAAQDGRIRYATGRNDYLKRLEHLIFLGYDYDSAKEIAQDDDKYQIESTRGLGNAQGG